MHINNWWNVTKFVFFMNNNKIIVKTHNENFLLHFHHQGQPSSKFVPVQASLLRRFSFSCRMSLLGYDTSHQIDRIEVTFESMEPSDRWNCFFSVEAIRDAVVNQTKVYFYIHSHSVVHSLVTWFDKNFHVLLFVACSFRICQSRKSRGIFDFVSLIYWIDYSSIRSNGSLSSVFRLRLFGRTNIFWLLRLFSSATGYEMLPETP